MKKISRKLCKAVAPIALKKHEKRSGKINTRVPGWRKEGYFSSILAFLEELPR